MPNDHRAIAQIARRQHGAISREQAMACGATPSAVAIAIDAGRWTRAARGVYVLASHGPTPAQRAAVATLARPGSLASHLTAAHLAEWVTSSPYLPTLTVPPGASARGRVATIHRSDVAPDERVLILGIPATAPARTLVDLAPELGPRRLSHLVDEAMHRRSTTHAAVVEQIERTWRLSLPARRALLAALEPWRGSIRPDTAAEARLLRLIASWGYPRPERQVRIVDEQDAVVARADGGWSLRRIAFEYDSREFHGPERWANDEERHAEIERLGWTLLHADAADLRPGERSFRDQLAAAWIASSSRLDVDPRALERAPRT